jgi:hypothetical protein
MNDWLSELISTPAREFTGFEAALSLMGALPPDQVIRLLDIRANTLQVRLHQLEAVTNGVPPNFPEIFLIEGEFQQALLRAEMAFVRTLLDRMRTGRITGLQSWRRLYELRAAGAGPDEIDAVLRAEFPLDMTWMEGPS